MTTVIHPDLAACLERENPRYHFVCEVSAPDVGQVLRRASDQWFTDTGDAPPGPRVSETPANTTAASATGALQLASTEGVLATRGSSLDDADFWILGTPDPAVVLRGLRWIPDRSLGTVLLRSFKAKVVRWLTVKHTRFQLQIFRATAVPGALRDVAGVRTPFLHWTFTPLLANPPVIQHADVPWAGVYAELTFDLRNQALELDASSRGGGGGPDAEKSAYYFQIIPLDATDGIAMFHWRVDTSSSPTEAGIGEFKQVIWARPSGRETEEWSEDLQEGKIPAFTLNVEEFAPTAEVVYELDLGATPGAEPTGRIAFERAVPPGTAATLELSTAGSGGPWTAVTHEDVVATKQQTYHLRLTMDADASQRRTPRVFSLGLEFRKKIDVSPEVILVPLSMECSVPFLEGAIGEGSLSVVRTGRRDYEDTASILGSQYAATRLEADTFLASDHPLVTRDKWIHLDRAGVSNRVPTETSEQFTLLSYLTRLKKKIPARRESINTVHVVDSAAADGSAVTVDSGTPLQGTTLGGNEYDNRRYYMRVRESAEPGVETGLIALIAGNTGTDTLVFDPPLQGELAAGDVIEVHSSEYTTTPLEWLDADPADIWWEVLTEHLEIPPERIGRADNGRAGRSGLPPRAQDIAPSNPDVRKVTRKISELTEGKQIIDWLSWIMGGTTIVDAGQIVFRQIYQLRDTDGTVTVGPPPVRQDAIFDPRDLINLQTPIGLEHRMTVVACNYGVNSAASDPDEFPFKTTQVIDVDALNWLTQQDLDMAGAAEIPEEIAAWCYNTEDSGQFLASELAWQLVDIGSTGLRVWPFALREARYDLSLGDSVAILTDSYTDYDPKTGQAIIGWIAARAVLIGISGDRRQFRALVPGLTAVKQLAGGNPGSIGGGRKRTMRLVYGDFQDAGNADGKQRHRYSDRGIHPYIGGDQISFQAERSLPAGAKVIAFRAMVYRENLTDSIEVGLTPLSPAGGALIANLTSTDTGWDPLEDDTFEHTMAADELLLFSLTLESAGGDGSDVSLLWAEIDYVVAA